ncbi:hypothetical protein BC792_11977 [Sphingobacterium allocomposti]|uniref:Fimbrillin-like protein n=1 Tax=Sphingobacterium allocomposti TaxID=415956 RepID=A0A5S5D671_9SPHI|nr:hypothetical protein [Sphingobacterium composti Yoo et al. 2007 non Ten et al. 2007]TYP91553.1 hypothetical protein BC792_11977 [Sphingobacterium composti Yoo et al. 2007 non Ten et al. 2007]
MKMNPLKTALALLAVSATIASCNPTTKNSEGETQDSTALSDTTGGIAVNPLKHSKEFPGATLKIASITAEKAGADSAKVTVKYDVSNFELTAQTEHDHHMANSHDGQHIHFILDNQPYVALYKPEHTVTVPLNSEHYLMSFLSRSFHESIKTADASKLVKFKVTADGQVEELPAPTELSLFYSRPKGDYKGEETKTLLLDFFVSNGTLAADGHKVKAEINGQEFTLDQWVPYEILNLPMGENTVKLTLINKDGNAVTGDNVSIERKINLSAE